MAVQEINAQTRTITGKKVRSLRSQGIIPAVLYGPGVIGTQSLSLNSREIERVYAQVGKAAMVQLRVQGGAARSVIIHQVQHDHLHRNLIHVDFLAPDMQAELTVSIPLAVIGEAPAVRDEAGIMVQVVTELEVSALPDHLPTVLTVNVSELAHIGEHVTAGDVTMPEGVHLVAPADETVAMIDHGAPQETEEAVAEADEDATETEAVASTESESAE